MPFSRSRFWTASTISLLTWSSKNASKSSALRLRRRLRHEARAANPLVRDRDRAPVRGQRHAPVVRADQLALEVPAALDRLAGPNPDAAAEVAPEVVELGQRPLGARRGDLDGVLAQQVTQVMRHARAQLEVDSPGTV